MMESYLDGQGDMKRWSESEKEREKERARDEGNETGVW